MNENAQRLAERRVLVLAPTGRDAILTRDVLGEGGVRSAICHDLSELIAQLEIGAGALLISEEAHLSYSDMVRPTIAQMTITNGDAQGTVIPLAEPEYLVGRHRENTIRFTDLGVSSFHARIFRGPDGYVIEDLKSRNGTWVNNTRVFHAVLKHNDRLRMGATDLQYQILYDAPA